MNTTPRRIATVFATFAALTTFAACISAPSSHTMGGSGSFTLEGPAGVWPSESPFSALEAGDPAEFEWDWLNSNDPEGGTELERSEVLPYRFESHGAVGSRDDGEWEVVVYIPDYAGPGSYSGDEVTMSFFWRAGSSESPSGEFIQGEILSVVGSPDCTAEVEEDELKGSAVCDAVRLEQEDVEVDGPHTITIHWSAADRLWENPSAGDE
jgi:hypothetical protein